MTRFGFAAAGVLLLSLGGCGMFGPKEPPTPCPRVSILGDAGRAVQFRPGPGRDPTDVLLEIEIAGISSACEFGRRNESVSVTTNIAVAATRGPAAQGDTVGNVNYFIAVTDREQNILAKQVFDARIAIPPGQRRAGVADETVQRIPLTTRRPGDIEILVGLQLTEEQLRQNRLNPR
jgi:hypothetical protein